MADDVMLQEAIAAAREGNRARARDLLTRLLRADQANPDYWLWMSAVVETEREQIYCLQSLLKLDPDNAAARRGLIILGALEPPPEEEFAEPALSEGEALPARPRRRRQTFREWWSVRHNRERALLGGVSLLAIPLIALVIVLYFRPDLVQNLWGQIAGVPAGPTPTAAAAAPSPPQNWEAGGAGTAPATGTAPSPPQNWGAGGAGTATATGTVVSATATPVPPTPTPVDPAATPLAALLGLTLTPTPIYAATPHPGSEAYRLGLRAYGQEDWERVIELMNQVLETDPQIADAHYFIGEAYRHTARQREAIAAYNEALAINPAYAPATLGRGLANLARGRPQDGRRDIDEAIQQDPAFVDAYLTRARLASEAGDYEAALADLEQVSTFAPDTPLVQIRRSLVLSRMGRYAEALSLASVANVNDPTILEGYLALGMARNGLGQYDAARPDLDLYLIYAPDDPGGRAQRGLSQNGLESYEAALQDFNQALDIEDNHLVALLGRGEAHLALENYEEARADFTAALNQQESLQGYLGRGRARMGLERPEGAIADFQAALSLEPESYTASLELGRAQFLAGRHAGAVETLTEALLLSGDDAEDSAVLVLRAQAYEALQEFDLALSDWESVIALRAADRETLGLAAEHINALTATATPTATP